MMSHEQGQHLIERVFGAHRFVAGQTVDPRIIRAIAADIRSEFDRAGARWDELALFAMQFMDSWRTHPHLSTEQCEAGIKAFREGYGLDAG
jgi:hypothetical protein